MRKYAPFTLLLPSEIDEALTIASQTLKVSKSEIVRNVLTDWLARAGFLPPSYLPKIELDVPIREKGEEN